MDRLYFSPKAALSKLNDGLELDIKVSGGFLYRPIRAAHVIFELLVDNGTKASRILRDEIRSRGAAES